MNEIQKEIIKQILYHENIAEAYLSSKESMNNYGLKDCKATLNHLYGLLKAYDTETP